MSHRCKKHENSTFISPSQGAKDRSSSPQGGEIDRTMSLPGTHTAYHCPSQGAEDRSSSPQGALKIVLLVPRGERMLCLHLPPGEKKDGIPPPAGGQRRIVIVPPRGHTRRSQSLPGGTSSSFNGPLGDCASGVSFHQGNCLYALHHHPQIGLLHRGRETNRPLHHPPPIGGGNTKTPLSLVPPRGAFRLGPKE